MNALEKENLELKAHIQRLYDLSVWGWLSAASDDESVCDEMKADIEKAFTVIGESPKQSLEAHDKAIRDKTIDEFQDDLSSALQSDLENGVRCLNEAAAKEFYSNYPQLGAMIGQIFDIETDGDNEM